VLRVDLRQVFLADVEPGQQRQGDDAPRRMGNEQGQDDEDVTVDVGRSAGPGVGLWCTPAPGRAAHTALSRVIQGEGQPRGPLEQRETTSIRRRRAMLSAFLPAAATAMEQDWN